MTETIVRFSKKQRVEHFIVMLLFTLLALTGFPQKFYEARWAGFIVNAIGGLDRVRFLHRMAGLLFSVATIFHIVRKRTFAATNGTCRRSVAKCASPVTNKLPVWRAVSASSRSFCSRASPMAS